MITDQDILLRFKDDKTKEQAFNDLLKKYQQKIYWHVRKMVIDHDDADDLVQDTFIKVWQSLANFRGDSQIYTWLYRIASNECLSFLAKKKKRISVSLDEVDHELNEKLEQDPVLSGDEIQLKLQKAILTLPDKQRLVFNLKYYDEMKYEEMAEVTDTSVGALKASYHHAVKKVEEYLKQD